MKSYFRDLLSSRPLELGWLRDGSSAENYYYNIRLQTSGDVFEPEAPLRGQIVSELVREAGIREVQAFSTAFLESFALAGTGGSFYAFVSVQDEPETRLGDLTDATVVSSAGTADAGTDGAETVDAGTNDAGTDGAEDGSGPQVAGYPAEEEELELSGGKRVRVLRIRRGSHPLVILLYLCGTDGEDRAKAWLGRAVRILPQDEADPEEAQMTERLRKAYFQRLLQVKLGVTV